MPFFVVLLVVPLGLCMLAGCDGCGAAPVVCGDGSLGAGEDEVTCCEDAGCVVGRCQAGQGCVMPWDDFCAAVDGCVASSPYRCVAGDVPAYDCGACGCSGADACTDGLCLSAAVRDAARDLVVVDDGLEDLIYTSLWRHLVNADALQLQELLERVGQRRQDDPRRDVLVVGISGGERTTKLLSIFDGAVLDPTCAELGAAAADGLYPQVDIVAAVGEDEANDVTCLWPGSYARCLPPHFAGCVEQAGRLAETLIVVDGDRAATVMDDALLRKAARANREQWGARFDDVLQVFVDAMDAVEPDAAFHVDVDGEPLEIRSIPDDDNDDVVWVFLPTTARPYRIGSFRVLWRDAPTQAFLATHDIRPGDCVFDVVDTLVNVDCENDGATLHAIVDSDTFSLISVETSR